MVTGKTRNKRESYNSKLIYIFGCISLVIILVILWLIVSRCSSNIQYQHPTGNEPASNDKQSCVTSSDRRICPVTSVGTLSCPQLQEENVNQDFQPDEALIDEILPSLESNMEGVFLVLLIFLSFVCLFVFHLFFNQFFLS